MALNEKEGYIMVLPDGRMTASTWAHLNWKCMTESPGITVPADALAGLMAAYVQMLGERAITDGRVRVTIDCDPVDQDEESRLP